MADPEAAPSENPFAQFGPRVGADPLPQPDSTPESPPAGASAAVEQDNQPENPFAKFGPKPEADEASSSAAGAFARGAEKGVVPAATGLVGAGLGGGAVVAAGAALGTTVGPWGTLAGGIGGGLIAGYGGSYLQNWAISKLPDSWKDKLGVDDRQARLDEAQHGTASFLGGLVPYAVTMHPSVGTVASALPENATALQQIMAHPVTSRVFGGALSGGVEVAQDEVSQGHADWKKAAISTAFGMVFNRPNVLGEALTAAGERPVRALAGIPPPTVARVADLKVMGPGITEGVFRGTEEQAPNAAMTAQEDARAEQAALGEPPEPDLHAVARQMEPELFAKYDDLVQRRDAFQAWHGEGPAHEMAEKHLATTEADLQEIAPTVQAAYRRAQETVTEAPEEPEQFKSFAEMLAARENGTGRQPDAGQAQEAQPSGEPSVPAGGEAPPVVAGQEPTPAPVLSGPQRSIGDQRAFIADDVTKNLIAAGRPEEEARAAGQLVAARYVTRAGRFEGKLGSPEELYSREGAAIAGPGGAAIAPRQAVQQYEAAGAARPAPEPVTPEAASSTKPGIVANDFDTADKIKNEWRKASPFKETEPFVQASWHNQRALSQVGEDIASATGAEFKNPGIKARTAEDIATIKDENKRKLAEAGRRRLEAKGQKHGIGGVTDQVRSGFDVKTPEQADQAIQMLAEKYPVTDEGWQTTESGYFDRKAYVKFPDGMIGEVQFWPPGMFDAKERRGGHGLYEGVRELPPWHPLIPEFKKTTRELYGDVRAKLSPEWNAVLGSGGSEPNLLANAGGESSTVSPASAALTSDQLPLENTQASESVTKQGSPSSEPAFKSDMQGTPSDKVGDKDTVVNDIFYAQPARGKIRISEGRRPVIQLMKDANASTFIHESGHQFLEELMRDVAHPEAPERLKADAQAARDWLGVGGKTFKTAKGSTYEVHPDGTTTRNKAARTDVGHEGDFGPKTRSAKTIYLDTPENAGNLSAAGLQGLGPKGARVIIKDGKASLLTWSENAGKWGIAPGQRDIPFTTEPGVGKAPLEVWKPADDVPGYEAYRGMHAGNPITEMAESDIKTKHHEKFARGFEQYLREGVAPSPELGSVFAKFRNWLLSIYQSIKGLGAEISPDIRGVFDRMLEMEPQRTVVAPERPTPTMLHDIHEAEATHSEPHEAEAAHDRIVAETNRYLADQHPETQNELQAAVGRVQEVEVEGVPEQPAGEAGPGGGQAIPSGAGAQPLVEGRGGPGTEPSGGVGGAEHGAEQPGGANAGAESAAVQRPDARSKLGDNAGTSLAPGPTDLFGRQPNYVDKSGTILIDKLNTSDDVRKALTESAAANDSFIGDRRGVVTDGEIIALANDIGMSGAEDLVTNHVKGQAFNAEQVWALRSLLRQAGGDMNAAAVKASQSGLDEDVLAFARAKERLKLIHATVAGARAESGRSQRAFRRMAGDADVANLAQIAQEDFGKTLFQLKEQAKLAAAIDNPANLNKWTQNVDKPSIGRMLLEGWIMGVLSGPSTQISNLLSNAIMLVQHYGVEKIVASGVGAVLHAAGREGTYTRLGEVGAAAKGIVQGAAPALLAAGESFKKGATGLLPGEEAPSSGILQGILHDDILQRGTLDPSATFRDVQAAVFATSRGVRDAIIVGGALLKAGGVEGSPFMSTKYDVQGAIPDIQVKGVNVLPVGTAIRATGRFLATADTFATGLNYSAGINAIAYRMASDEGLTGSAFAQRIAQLRNQPTPEMMADAAGQARQTTFMDKAGPFVKAINNLTAVKVNIPGIGETQLLKFVAPFTNVVSRILDQTIIKRTPVGALLSKEIQADLLGKNGNIAQETAAARMLIGSAILLGFGSLAAEGYVTGAGPSDPKENAIWRLTNQPHSMKIGNTFYQIQKLGPMGMLMSMAADLHDVRNHVDNEGWEHAAALLFKATIQNTLDQSSLQGPAEMMKAAEDPDRYGQQYIRTFLASFVPGDVNWIAKSRDPYMRQAWTAMDAIKARVPGYSETLHPKIDLWGNPVPSREQLGGMTGIYTQAVNADPVNKAMADLGMKTGPVEKKLRGVELTPDQYEFFARTAGRMTKMRLDTVVRSHQWDTFPTYQKTQLINEIVKQSRTSAEGLLFANKALDGTKILMQAHDDKMTLIKTGKKPVR